MRRIHCLALLSLSPLACRPHPSVAPDATVDSAALPPPEAVQIIPEGADNHWTLAGTLYRSPLRDRAVGANKAVLLVHQLGSRKEEWAPLIQRLRGRQGITTLAIDLRGHGQSVYGTGAPAVGWESFGSSTELWSGTIHDVAAAVRFLRGTVTATSIVIVGSSIGSSAALLAATSTEEAVSDNVAGVVMLSPGLAYHGLDIRDAVARSASGGRPVFMLAGALDAPSAEAVRLLAPLAGPRAEHFVLPDARQHGVSLPNSDARQWDRVNDWIRQVLAIPRIPAPTANTPTPDGGH